MAAETERIKQLCEEAIRDRVFPGCVVGYLRDGKTTVIPAGRLTYEANAPKVTADTVYDVASITKSIPTSSLLLHLVELGLLTLDDWLVDFIPEIQNQYRDKIRIRHLLTYTVVFDIPGGLSAVAKEQPDKILETIFSAPLKAPPGQAYFYTNAPAILMGMVVERVSKVPLNEFANAVYGRLPMPRTSFSTGWHSEDAMAPSEVDWRGELRGAVNDESAWVLRQGGRVAGHAGLFSTAPDMLVFAQMLLNGGRYGRHQYFTPETVMTMHTNQIADLGKSTGMGWELRYPLVPDGVGSDQVFGKTGYTGCAIVIDPESKIAFTHMSNRTYPHRPNTPDGIRGFRHELAKLILG